MSKSTEIEIILNQIYEQLAKKIIYDKFIVQEYRQTIVHHMNAPFLQY